LNVAFSPSFVSRFNDRRSEVRVVRPRRVRRRRPQVPAQQRPPGDAAMIARGKTLDDIHCLLCHDADLRGGEQGGSNLLRSALTLNDQSGELLQPVIREGRKNPGLPSMPANDLSTDDIRAIAEYIH
jgi:cytochrome c oxidase cbb3-type subunit 3